jgi:adenosylcobyric acid synthase
LDLLILPGTKNTISDLIYLKETGLSARIRAFAGAGGRVTGICGGYQMLGEEVRDPLGVEGPPRTETGLGILPVVTTMAGTKTTTQVEAKVPGRPGYGGVVAGYEIHMGLTEPLGPGRPAFEMTSRNGEPTGEMDGWMSPDGRVWGTYLHGLFDNDRFRRDFLAELTPGRPEGKDGVGVLSFKDFQEAQLDRLAGLLRQHLDIARIRALIQP